MQFENINWDELTLMVMN